MNFKSISSILLSAFLIIAPLYSATSNAMDENKNVQAQQNQAEATNVDQDREILTWLIALNKNEIAAAKIAIKKTSNPNVKKFAEAMIKHHKQNLQETKKLMNEAKLKPLNTDAIKDMESKNKEELSKLSSTDKKDFDKAYMNAMVDGHTEALKTLDQDISKASANPKLEAHLKATQATVNQHLEEAKSIQSNLG